MMSSYGHQLGAATAGHGQNNISRRGGAIRWRAGIGARRYGSDCERSGHRTGRTVGRSKCHPRESRIRCNCKRQAGWHCRGDRNHLDRSSRISGCVVSDAGDGDAGSDKS